MYEVYNPSIYNAFFKEERKKRNLKLEDLSKQIHYSLGLLSQLENSPNLLNNDKTSILLIFYGYDIEYLNNFDKKLNQLAKRFTNSLLYMNNDEVEIAYQELSLFLSDYKNTILYTIYHTCEFMYKVYFYKNSHADALAPLISSNQYYEDHLSAILYIYLARHCIQFMNYNQAFDYLSHPIFNRITDLNIQGFRYISLSTSYMRVKNIGQSIKYCDEAITCFTNTNNYRRLLNTNIEKGNQFLKIKDYQGALVHNKRVLDTARKYNYLQEVRSFLNNNAFIYMMQNKYEKALACFEEMPKSEMKEKHYCSYVVCLVETNHNDEALVLTDYWVKKANNPYLKSTFTVYHEYLLTNDLRKLNKGLIKIVKDFKNSIDMFEIEYLYVLIAHHYKKLNMYKSCMEYLEKLRELDYYD